MQRIATINVKDKKQLEKGMKTNAKNSPSLLIPMALHVQYWDLNDLLYINDKLRLSRRLARASRPSTSYVLLLIQLKVLSHSDTFYLTQAKPLQIIAAEWKFSDSDDPFYFTKSTNEKRHLWNCEFMHFLFTPIPIVSTYHHQTKIASVCK